MGSLGRVDISPKRTIAAPSSPIFPSHSRFPTPSSPRKRESRRFQPRLPPETSTNRERTNPFSLDGLTGAGLAFRHSRESGNPDAFSQDCHPKQVRIASGQIPSPLMGLQGQVWLFVIPAKAGIQTLSAKIATRNQVQIASDKSLPPLWSCRRRFGFSSFPRKR